MDAASHVRAGGKWFFDDVPDVSRIIGENAKNRNLDAGAAAGGSFQHAGIPGAEVAMAESDSPANLAARPGLKLDVGDRG